jgi:hypothetical protein
MMLSTRESGREPPRTRGLRGARTTIVLLLVALAAAGVGWWARGRFARGGPSGAGLAPAVSRVARGRIEQSIRARGIVKPGPNALVRVGFPFPQDQARRISRLAAVEGDVVAPGSELARLDNDDLKASRERQAAGLQTVERRLQALKILEPIEIRKAEAEVAERKAEHEQATRNLGRLEVLRDRELVSVQQREIAATDRALALARAEAAAVNLEQVRANLRTEISTLGAQVEEAKAAFRAIEVQLRWSTLRSPLSTPAQVYAVHQRQGEVTSGQPNAPVLTLLDLGQLQVQLFVDEADFGRIQIGQPATLRVESYRDKALKGEIVRVLPQPIQQENVVYYLAVVDVAADQKALLRPEMTCLAFVQAGVKENVLWLPVSAVRSRAAGWYVLRPGSNGPVEVSIEIGWRNQERVEIRRGLSEGDEVLEP